MLKHQETQQQSPIQHYGGRYIYKMSCPNVHWSRPSEPQTRGTLGLKLNFTFLPISHQWKVLLPIVFNSFEDLGLSYIFVERNSYCDRNYNSYELFSFFRPNVPHLPLPSP